MEHTPRPYIAGFWRRSFAFLIDLIVVGLCCLCISGIFKSQIIAHPIIFALLGYALVVAYYGLCNSSLNQGQTLGKSLLKVKVIHSSGDYLSVPQSLLRAAIVYAPICLLSACQFIG